MLRIVLLLALVGCGVKSNKGGIDYTNALNKVDAQPISKGDELIQGVNDVIGQMDAMKTVYAQNAVPAQESLLKTARLLKGLREYCARPGLLQIEFKNCAKLFTYEDRNEPLVLKIHQHFEWQPLNCLSPLVLQASRPPRSKFTFFETQRLKIPGKSRLREGKYQDPEPV